MKPTPIFWGCTFTHNYPFIIKSTKTLLDNLGVGVEDISEFGCCPDPVYVKTLGREINLALSARNLALAGKKGDTLMVACNGCYNVLHEAAEELRKKETRDEINEALPQSCRYEGNVKVMHVLNAIYSKLPILKTRLRNPLRGLKVAVHYGCHAIYPPAVYSDDPKKPTSMDELVQATGAQSIEYESKLDCCGVPVAAFDKDEGDRLLSKKLADIKGKADCIVTSCPACFMRFDTLPQEMKDQGLPVLHITELLCLALGVGAEDLFFEGHTTKVDKVLDKIGVQKTDEARIIEKCFDATELASHCEACREECIAAVTTRNSEKPFDPLFAVDKLREGKLKELIDGQEIWRCLQCGRCEENCPNNLGLKKMYVKLRELAVAENKGPMSMADKSKMLEETGYGMPKRAGIRKKMNMAPAPDLDSAEFKNIINKIKRKKK